MTYKLDWHFKIHKYFVTHQRYY